MWGYCGEEEQIDMSNLNPCMQTIVTDIKTLTNDINGIITKFSGTSPGYNWELKDGSLTGGTGATNPPAAYNHSTGTITTTFDSQAWKDATDLSWARTILHETVHAFLAAEFAISRPNWVATYPQMVAEWGRLQNWNAVHHEEMGRSIINEISLSLQELGAKKGYNFSTQFYDDLSWGGLQNTSTFQSLSPTEQKRILDVIATELTGKDSQGVNKTQKGTNAGC